MITRQSDAPTLDFRLLQDYFENNHPEIIVTILAKKLENGIANKISYMFYILKIMYHLATAKVCAVDGYCIPVSILKHKKKLTVVQLWHASGAIKKFGYQILDKPEGAKSWVANAMCMHRNYDYVLAPSEITKKIFAQAFNVSEETIIKLGLPRLEYIVNKKFDKSKQLLKEYPQLKGKETILYIPTFRKNKPTDLTEILNYPLDKDKYSLIIRLHPLDKTQVPEEYTVDRQYKSFDLLKIADYIITDYSILSVEASILNKPIFLYLYDYDEYKEERGLNVELEKELSSFTSRSFHDIMTKIEEKDYNMNELQLFKNKYIEIDTNDVINTLGDTLLKLYKENK